MAALAALALALPAPAAAPVSSAQLALMPLPKSALGKMAATLPLALDSGPISNADAAGNANGKVTEKTVAALGRLGGYLLDYGNELSGRTGVTRIATEVDVYKDAASARRGFAFWKKDEQNVAALRKAGMHISVAEVALPALGDDRFAFAGTIRLPGLKPIYGIDAYVRAGRLIAEVAVAADRATAQALAPSLLRRLEARVRAVLAGKVHEKPVALPSKKPGPPPKGPDLAAFAVRPADFGTGKVASRGYVLDKNFSPLAKYQVLLQPAGAYSTLEQSIMLLHSVPEATDTFAALAAFLSQKGAIADPSIKKVSIAPVAVGAGDAARGQIVTVTLTSGLTVYEALAMVRVGRIVETLTAVTPAKLHPSAVKALAKLGVDRLKGKPGTKKPSPLTS